MSANIQSVGDLGMVGPDFETLVQQFAERRKASEKAAQDTEGNDWTAVRELWVSQVRELFDRMEGWLGLVIAAGSVQSVRAPRLLVEESLGEYAIESLELKVGSLKMMFEPVGTLILNAFGQIDVVGPEGRVVLLLQGGDETWPTISGQKQAEWFILHPGGISRAAVRSRVGLRWMSGTRAVRRTLEEGTFLELFMDLFGILY
jgi:hypothetical protein